jgi:hypothetical protein
MDLRVAIMRERADAPVGMSVSWRIIRLDFSKLTHNVSPVQSNPQLLSAQSLPGLIKNESRRGTPLGSVDWGIR